MKRLIILVGSLAAVAAFSAPSQGASIVNSDGEPRTVIVTDGGSQQELSLGAGETAEFCPQGCFVSLQGERETLLGTEAVEIKGGKLRIR